jgi:hypothetical protein
MVKYILIDDKNKAFNGDIIKYLDEWEQQKGIGVLLKKVEDPFKPLTESYYLLRDINTKKIWKVKCNRYTFYKKDNSVSDISSLFTEHPLFQSVVKDIKNNI